MTIIDQLENYSQQIKNLESRVMLIAGDMASAEADQLLQHADEALAQAAKYLKDAVTAEIGQAIFEGAL